MSISPSPKTEEELKALPELACDEPVFALRATDDDAVFLFRHGDKVFSPVYAYGKWWKQEQWIP